MVYKINSLEDSANPGDGKITYRECALALPVTSPYNIPSGRPRYCVFDVAGAIMMQSPAIITTDKLYIAGQTSPGGIEFRLGANYAPVDSLISNSRQADMIVRHVRVRIGEHPDRPSDNGDPIRLGDSRRQIIDHVSSMFGTDESLDAHCTDCTIQWTIIGPNMCRNAGHGTTSFHCKTFFLKPASKVTLAYNLSQHGEQRGMNVAVGNFPSAAGSTSQGDFIHNVLYNFGEEGGLLSSQYGSPYANYIGNVYFAGPRSVRFVHNALIALYNAASNFPYGFNVYVRNNVSPRNRISGQFGSSVTDPARAAAMLYGNTAANTYCGVNAAGAQDCSVGGLNVVQSKAIATAPGVNGQQFENWMIGSPMQGMRDVLAFAGAERCRDGSCRDNVDRYYIDDVRTCDSAPYLFSSDWPSRVADSGGFAQISPTGSARVDSDNDGMPDAWENQFSGTDANRWDANADPDGDGYPNIEEYLNWLAADDVRYRGIYGSGTGRLPAYNCGRPQFS